MNIRNAAVPALLLCITTSAQIVGPSVNMVTGVSWPDGDPFLQRQNEPSIAVSSRNALHILGGANDYRTVDLPGAAGDSPIGDAWLGVFRSLDGGLTWKSTLIPGYPQDASLEGKASPLKGLQAGADPVVRPGTNGLLYFGGLAFQRPHGSGTSKIFVARHIDDNIGGTGDTIRYLSTSVVKESDANHFEDKPTFATDIPRKGAKICSIPGTLARKDATGKDVPGIPGQAFPGGRVYAAWTEFDVVAGQPLNKGKILFSYSEDCGATWVASRAISGFEDSNQGASIAVNQSSGAVYVAWRVIPQNFKIGRILYTESIDSGASFAPPQTVAEFFPLDQSTAGATQGGFMFRTTSYPSIAVDGEGVLGDGIGSLYIAWAQRTAGPISDARIVVVTSATSNPQREWECIFQGCTVWSQPVVVDPKAPRGHQFMPSLSFSNGKLTAVWYDLRDTNVRTIYQPIPNAPGVEAPPSYDETRTLDGQPDFGPIIRDLPHVRRHTLDVRLAQRVPSGLGSFGDSVRISQYAFGTRSRLSTVVEQLEVDPPNLPMFQLGTVPFFGDYIDLGGATYVANADGTWRFNTRADDPESLHVVWTDNRNVSPPTDGDWRNYTPLALASPIDLSKAYPSCQAGHAGIRNQDIYTSRVTSGLVVSTKTNANTFGVDPANPQQLVQRTFPVTLQNASNTPRTYVVSVASQPPGGAASFLQFIAAAAPQDYSRIQLRVAPHSSATRSLFVTSRDPYARVDVNVSEAADDGSPVIGGQRAALTINRDGTLPLIPGQNSTTRELFNPDISNPDISNPDISNPDISNPDISNPDISNPDISNPDISNPDISNPAFHNPDISNPDISNPDISNRSLANIRLANPDISNPDISNPDISNPDISNPDISNPDISNPDISNAALTDTTWAVTNLGNTAGSYLLKFLENRPVPDGVTLQLLASKRTNKIADDNCTVKIQPSYTVILNSAVVPLAASADTPKGKQAAAADRLMSVRVTDASTLAIPSIPIAPGERVLITIRALDRRTNDPLVARLRYDPATALTPVPVPDSVNTGDAQPTLPLTILTSQLDAAAVGRPYSQTLAAAGGTPPYTWAPSPATPLLPGLVLTASGVLAGTVLSTGSVDVWVFVTDSAGRSAKKLLTLTTNSPAGSFLIATTSPVAAASVGSAYSLTLASTGGTGAISWSLLSPSTALPAGLTLSAQGLISGTPTATGLYKFIIRASDTATRSDTRTLAMIVRDPRLRITPTITAVVSAGPGMTDIASGSWVSIYGTGLSTETKLWDIADFTTNNLPRSLKGVGVKINGVPAAVSYVSPGQILVLAPQIGATGTVQVDVITGGFTASGTANVQTYAPAFFAFPQGYIAAVFPTGVLVGPVGLFPVAPASTRPAVPGDSVQLFGTGFGPTLPAVDPSQIFIGAAPLKPGTSLTVTIGGVPAPVTFAGLSGTGLYQLNVVIPALAPGDYDVVATLGDASSPSGRKITIGASTSK